MQFLNRLGNRIITGFWYVLFLPMVYFAWTSSNIILGDNAKFGTSTTMVTTTFIILMTALIVALGTYPKFRKLLTKIFIQHQLITASCLLGLVVIGQIFFVTLVHPVSGFDAGMLHYAAVDPKHVLEPGVTSYYSLNQNNLPIMLFMRWLVVQSGQTSWQFFDYLTIAFVDLSAIFNLGSVYLAKKSALGTAMYVHVLWLVVFPSILMPYTDAWVLPLVSLILLCYMIILKTAWPGWTHLLAVVVMAISVVLTYFMKPSAIIPVIAMAIVALLDWLIKTHHWIKQEILMVLVSLLGFGLAAGSTYWLVNQTVQNQTYIAIDHSRNIPAIHFAAMGVYDEGGYSEEQAIQMAVLPTKQQKTDYSVKMLKQRLHQLGIWGYFKFLVMKQRNNTADGTFGWLKEGHFFRENQRPSQKGLSNQIKNYIYLYGEHIADFRFIAQFNWIVILTIIAFGWGPYDRKIQVLRLSVIGGLLFLLLFEGGRSRYLIQYLPCFLLLAIFSFDNCRMNLRKLRHYFFPKTESAISRK